MGRTPDYMNVKFASFAGRWKDWVGADGRNEEGAHNIVAFQKRLAREDVSLTHTIIHPTIDKSTDSQIVGNPVPVHKVGETPAAIVVRGARILATLAPFADEIAVYPAHPLPPGAEAYALAFSIPVDSPGLLFMCRDSAASPGAHVFDRPLSTRLDEQDAFVIFDDVEIPRVPFLDAHRPLQHRRHHRPARQHDEPDHHPRAHQAGVRVRPRRPDGGGDRRHEPGDAGDAGRTPRLRRGHAQRSCSAEHGGGRRGVSPTVGPRPHAVHGDVVPR
jgi:hypothetical protein